MSPFILPKEELTPCERQKLYWAGKEVDHIPYSLIGTEAASILYNIDIRTTYDSVETVLEIEKKLVQDFGIGCMNVGPRLKGIAEALGAKMKYPPNSMYMIAEPLLKDYHDLDKLKIINPYKDGKLPIMLKMLDQLKKSYKGFDTVKSGVPGPISLALTLRDAGVFLRDLSRNPEMVHHLLQFSLECILAWIKAVYDEFGCICSIADPVSSMDILGKKQFEIYSKPYLKELVKRTEKLTGKKPGIHICGRSKKIWNDISEIGFSSFSVDNCEDLEELKNSIGSCMAISGNIPPVDVIKNGSTYDVVESVKECLRKASDNPKGFILSPGCQIPLGTQKENLISYIWAARTYGKNAKIGKNVIMQVNDNK